MCLSNYELLWIKSQKSDIRGIFALMPLTSFLLVFSLFSIVGLAPSISFINYFSLFKTLYNNNLFFSLFIVILNNLTVAIIIFKIYKIIIFVPKKSINQQINSNIKNHDQTEEFVNNIETKSQKAYQDDLIDSQNYKDDDFKILLKIAQKIDYDSRLIISTLIVAILNCASLLLNNNLIF
jgi:NADH:ubiquinone oxidoreductase subunit 5 (subunit L)/multisubunit Na+/H+ antiporter MnhA subunit